MLAPVSRSAWLGLATNRTRKSPTQRRRVYLIYLASTAPHPLRRAASGAHREVNAVGFRREKKSEVKRDKIDQRDMLVHMLHRFSFLLDRSIRKTPIKGPRRAMAWRPAGLRRHPRHDRAHRRRCERGVVRVFGSARGVSFKSASPKMRAFDVHSSSRSRSHPPESPAATAPPPPHHLASKLTTKGLTENAAGKRTFCDRVAAQVGAGRPDRRVSFIFIPPKIPKLVCLSSQYFANLFNWHTCK